MAKRIDVEPAQNEVAKGRALLVCAYEDDDRWQKYRLAGAISFAEFERGAASLAKDREIIFYCA